MKDKIREIKKERRSGGHLHVVEDISGSVTHVVFVLREIFCPSRVKFSLHRYNTICPSMLLSHTSGLQHVIRIMQVESSHYDY